MTASFVTTLLLFPAAMQAQAASGYLERYREILALAPVPGKVADISELVLRRDAVELRLDRGKLYLLTEVGNRTVGAVFKGTGRFIFTPPLPVEQAQLQRFAGRPALDDSITQAILLFADSTMDQLRALAFRAAEIPGDVRGDVRSLLDKFKGDNEGSFNSAVIDPLLNGERSDFFLAHVDRVHGDDLLFLLDPRASEAVELLRPVGKTRWGTNWAVVNRFPTARPLPGSAGAWTYRERASIPRYRVEVWLTPTGSADLNFEASATLTVTAREAVGPWLHFGLHPKLVVDSARWADGVASTFKAKDDDALWVRANRRLAPGDSVSLTLFYHGNLIDRYDNWFYIDPGADWWPTNRQGSDDAVFDITYHSPNWYPLASVGERVDSTVVGKVLTTRWVTKRSSPFATFNLGLFDNYHLDRPGEPVINVLISDDAHRLLRRQVAQEGGVFLEQRHMRENVAADVSNSLKWFTHLFGQPPDNQYWVTEIPYMEGVSFPGVIHLSWITFSQTQLNGFDEYFRAHEVAHQWWGNGVRPASYRDAWLSEGLASFCGLWYLQSLRKRNDEYFKFLDHYAEEIRAVRSEAGPVWLGYRNSITDGTPTYHTMIYYKGSWVFHMLRTMMLDLQTRKEDRFTAMMQDFYTSYQGDRASTDDFQQLVERHIGVPMGWFFDQWLRGTALPTYHVAWKNETTDAGQNRVRLRVTQEGVPSDFQAYVLVSLNLGNNRFANFRVKVHGGQTEYLSPVLPTPAKEVSFNELHSVLAEVKMESW